MVLVKFKQGNKTFKHFQSYCSIIVLFLTFSISSGQVNNDDELAKEELISASGNDLVSSNCTEGCESSEITSPNSTSNENVIEDYNDETTNGNSVGYFSNYCNIFAKIQKII